MLRPRANDAARADVTPRPPVADPPFTPTSPGRGAHPLDRGPGGYYYATASSAERRRTRSKDTEAIQVGPLLRVKMSRPDSRAWQCVNWRVWSRAGHFRSGEIWCEVRSEVGVVVSPRKSGEESVLPLNAPVHSAGLRDWIAPEAHARD